MSSEGGHGGAPLWRACLRLPPPCHALPRDPRHGACIPGRAGKDQGRESGVGWLLWAWTKHSAELSAGSDAGIGSLPLRPPRGKSGGMLQRRRGPCIRVSPLHTAQARPAQQMTLKQRNMQWPDAAREESGPAPARLALDWACASCDRRGRWQRCSRCLAVRYCSDDCQAAHWQLHRVHCRRHRAAQRDGQSASAPAGGAIPRGSQTDGAGTDTMRSSARQAGTSS